MPHLASFFDSIEIAQTTYKSELLGTIIDSYTTHFPDLDAAKVVIVGCPCETDETKGTAESPNEIRQELYKLSIPHQAAKIADLGNLKLKGSAQEWGEMIGYVVEKLLSLEKIVILLGGIKEIAYGQTLSYRYTGIESEDSQTNYAYISPFLDLRDEEGSPSSLNYRIFNQYPPTVNVFTGLGYQSYKVVGSELDLLRNLSFPYVRYGILQGQMYMAEPYLREANAVCLDISAVRHADSPGATQPLPAGFTVMEICQLARYAGNAPDVSTFSIVEYNQSQDIHRQTATLSAMILWYFIEGIYHRRPEHPDLQPEQFTKYRVKVNAGIEEIVFFQSNLTGLWWMEVVNSPRKSVVPCSEAEYQSVVGDEIPDKWWQVFNRLA